MKNILLTGATGNIGKNLLKYLSKKKFKTTVLSRNKLDNFKTIQFDFENRKIPKSFLLNIDAVIHLAAYSSDEGKFDVYRKKKYLNLNHKKTIELAKLSIKNNVKCFIFISSYKAMYHNHISNEKEVFDYGSLKRFTETKLLKLFKESKTILYILRFPVIFGPNIKNNLSLMRNVIRFGLLPKIPNTSNRKQFIHIDDAVAAIYLLLNKKYKKNSTYYLTDMKIYSISEIQKILTELEGKTLPILPFPIYLFKLLSKLNSHVNLIFKKLFEDDFFEDHTSFFPDYYKLKTLRQFDETNI